MLAGTSLDAAIAAAGDSCPGTERGLLRELASGTLRFHIRHRALLRSLLDRPLRDRDRPLEALLAVGLYQLDHLRIPDHAAVNATVGACALLERPWASKLVNAVLRRYLREGSTLTATLAPSERAACPGWLYKRLARHWPENLPALIDASNTRPPMVLRVNRLRCSREAYLAELARAGLDAAPGTMGPDAVYLARGVEIADLPGFEQGWVSVQDEAAQVAAQLLPLAPGLSVLDACAAPGGKACHLLEREPSLDLLATDIDEQRLRLVAENLARLGLAARVEQADGRAPEAAPGPGFDRIVIDAPCSGSGVLRRHPDIKALRRATDLPALAGRQLALLRALFPRLKPGGYLLYATCSILPEENEQIVTAFLREEPRAAPAPFAVPLGVAREAGIQLLPGASSHDGLYYALLQRTAS